VAKRVLVTGGAGFIPSNFIHHLLAKTPYEVVSLDALTYAGNLDNLNGAMSHERLSFVQGDIRDAELVRDIVAEVDVIVNAAAESHVEKSIEEGAREFVTTNVEGTQILLDAIREAPVERFILFSSSEVYGTAESAPMDEEHPINPRSPYAATKAGADRLAYSYFVTYGLPVVIVRPFNNYGPRQHPEKVVPRFITQALQDLPLTIHGDGHASGRRARGVRQALVAEDIRARETRAGRPAHRLDGQDGAPDRLAGAHVVRGRSRAHHRVVPRK
jgi:dTDP-glucose 4,6-dehydratase